MGGGEKAQGAEIAARHSIAGDAMAGEHVYAQRRARLHYDIGPLEWRLGRRRGAAGALVDEQHFPAEPSKVFVSHAFEPSDDYHRVFEYLESSHNFYYRNCSDPDAKPADRDAMKEELRRQIGSAEVVIVPSGSTSQNREWIDFQLNCAKGLDKPVVVLEAFGVKEKLPVQLEALGDEIVEWNERSIADAIRRQARHEDTTRWDVVDFKMD